MQPQVRFQMIGVSDLVDYQRLLRSLTAPERPRRDEMKAHATAPSSRAWLEDPALDDYVVRISGHGIAGALSPVTCLLVGVRKT